MRIRLHQLNHQPRGTETSSEVIIGEVIDVAPQSGHAMRDFVDGSIRHDLVPVPLASSATVLLSALVLTGCLVSGWLVAVKNGRLPCGGPLCSAATLGGHPDLMLALSLCSSAALAVLAIVTRAFTRANRPQLVALWVAAAACFAAVAGAVLVTLAVAVATLLAIVVLAGLLIFVAQTA